MKKSILMGVSVLSLLGVVGAAGLSFASRNAVNETAAASVATYTYHFTVPKSLPWTRVYAYVWQGAGTNTPGNYKTGWDANQMTWEYNNAEGEAVYHVSINLDWVPEKIIFHQNYEGNANKTVDISIGSNAAWYYNGTDTDGLRNVNAWAKNPNLTREYYLYLNSATLTTNNLKFYAWNNNDAENPMTAYPGTAMTLVSGNIYTTGEVPCYYNSLIFNSDYVDSENQKKTGDLRDITGCDGMCYNLFGYNWISLIQAKTQQWVDTYMHMGDYDPTKATTGQEIVEPYGQCTVYFPLAKSNITSEIYEELTSNPVFNDAAARYAAWATHIGQSGDPSVSSKIVTGYATESQDAMMVVITIAIVSLAAVGSLFLLRKRKAE